MQNCKAFLIGNGESRSGFDLSSLKDKGLIIGCNALYRDFEPDILVSIDKAMIEEVMANYGGVLAYRLQEACGSYIKLEDKRLTDNGFSSGGTSIMVAIYLGRREIYLIGHDLNQIPNKNTRNNVYNDTPNYKPSTSYCTDYAKFSEDMRSIIVNCPRVEFVFVNNNQDRLFKHVNVRYITYREFANELSGN